MAAGRFVIPWAVIGLLEFPGRVDPLILNATECLNDFHPDRRQPDIKASGWRRSVHR